jgi:SAM-dependent methyltransferase
MSHLARRPSDDPHTMQRRLEREMEHDRKIAARAEQIWNWDSPAGRRRADRRAAFFVEHAGLRAGVRAIELGCGTGLFVERVARSGATVVGLELSPNLLGQAMARVGSLPNVALARGDAHRLAHPDGSVDAVYGSSILHHLHLDLALREAHRVLKPGGRIVFTEPNILNPQVAFMFLVGPRYYFGLSKDEMAFSRSRARRTLEEIGYVDVEVTPFDFLHPATPPRWLDAVSRLGRRLEDTPVVRRIAGSLLIRARKG